MLVAWACTGFERDHEARPHPRASEPDAATQPDASTDSSIDERDSGSEPSLSDASIGVHVALDSDRAVSVEVPLEGGRVAATGADGTIYELTIPAGALLEPTRITLTPVRQISGLPIAGSDCDGCGHVHPADLTDSVPRDA